MRASLDRLRSFRPRVIELEGRLLPSTFVVTITDDAGPGSLRQAILDSNATTGLNTIAFDIGDGGVQTIRPTSALPTITNPVVIDGTTQPGYGGAPLIELAGPSGTRNFDGLVITAGGSTVRGLVIHDFRYGIHLSVNGSNLIAGDYVGTDPTGAVAAPNTQGVFIEPSSGNTVGGTASGDRNVISGNAYDGIDAANNLGLVVQGNYLGTDVAGTAALGNGRNGLRIDAPGFTGALIGGTHAGAGNLISGNLRGLDLAGADNLVQGNRIGTDRTGTASLGNQTGIDLEGDGHNTIGGTARGAGNLISGNGIGIQSGDGSLLNVIQGNLIGTDITGTVAVGSNLGISLGFSVNQVGGTGSGAANVISGNRGDGVDVVGSNNLFQGNLIGTDITGTRPLGNGQKGVNLFLDGVNNTIGGTAPGAGNVIAANGDAGIYSNLEGTLIQGNLIGVDATGGPMGNAGDGVFLAGADRNVVGGSDPGAGNVIANSGLDGVRMDFGRQDPIRGNAIFASGNLGIELLHNGNNNQAFPALDSALWAHGRITIAGALQSTPDTSFNLEFFGDRECNRSGYGEGQTFLGGSTVTTDDSGAARFTVTFRLGRVNPGQYVAATATDPSGNTSEFSRCVAIEFPTPSAEALAPATPLTVTTGSSPHQLYLPASSSPVTISSRRAQVPFDFSGMNQSVAGLPPTLRSLAWFWSEEAQLVFGNDEWSGLNPDWFLGSRGSPGR
jgi:hypothetical protein